MRIQRKIHHLLADNGVTGRDFKYVVKESHHHSFDWSRPIIVTDKMDGTTVQADNQAVYKRYDKLKAGDPAKFTASEEDRYGLIVLNESEPQNKWIFEAVKPFLPLIQNLPSAYTVYFEVFGAKINARYRDKAHSIRVFDYAFNDQYLSFNETLLLAEKTGLPTVGFTAASFSGVEGVVQKLESASHIDAELKNYELEGWVLRQNDGIAKIRKNDLKKLEDS